MKKLYMSAGLPLLSILIFGCGGDRSALYDGSGNRITASGNKVLWIYDTEDGKKMIKNNFVYIPGGFDVDGDGIDEDGFWLAKYEAVESNETLTVKPIEISDFIRDKFLIYNGKNEKFDLQLDQNDTGFADISLSDLSDFRANRVYFSAQKESVGGYSPIEAAYALENSQIKDSKWSISLPSEKQWMQVVKLVINNKKNWNGEEVEKGKLYQGDRYDGNDRRYFVIENSLLGVDPLVPTDYKTQVFDLSGSKAEWTNGMFAIDDRFLGGDAGMVEYTMLGANTPLWWMPILKDRNRPLHSVFGAGKYFDGSTTSGATDTLNLTGNSGDIDPYAVVARGGSKARGDKELVGVSAAKLNYGLGFKDPSIGFRAASAYIKEP